MSELSKRILSALMVLGAQSPEKALSAADLAAKLGVEQADAQKEVDGLVKGGYAKVASQEEGKVFLTGTGIITASSTYS